MHLQPVASHLCRWLWNFNTKAIVTVLAVHLRGFSVWEEGATTSQR
jgi:hypothetical protein